MMPLLEIRALEAGYDGASVIRSIDLAVVAGEVVAVLGSNGAGKSTLVKALAGIVPTCSGSIRFAGRDITHLPAHERARKGIALVPEGRRLFPEMSVLENLEAGALARSEKMLSAADLVEVYSLFPVLAAKQRQTARTLSGGEQQMLAVARGLMARPQLLLLDEPSLGLAPMVVRGLFDTISALAGRGLAILLAEQNLRAALRVAGRGYVLRTGQIVFQGSREELRARGDLPELYWGKVFSTGEQK